MDGAKAASSPFPDAGQVPIQRNPPLAPSQELAYRNKCIQLKKRLAEIETNNDNTRRRIAAEKERVQKQRLLRALLLHQLREIMETPGRKFKPEELEKMGIVINGEPDDDDAHAHPRPRPDGEVLLDDSSDNSDEDIPEPGDRPTRNRRQGPNYRGEAVMNAHAPSQSANPSLYQASGLPTIAPASSYSPATAREPLLTSSFQTPGGVTAGSPQQYPLSHQSQFVQDARYGHSSPIQSRGQPGPAEILSQSQQASAAVRSLSASGAPQPHGSPQQETNGYRGSAAVSIPQPVRPAPPYNQFCDHMRPQLEADDYPREHIQGRIDEEWRKLSEENRGLWHDRYNEQMREYEDQMDLWKRAQRRAGEVTPISSSTRGPAAFR